MGLTEVITHLPRLCACARALRRQILEWRPDVFIGVDYKEFNLGLARQLKRARPRHRAIREPAGLGVAPGARAHHRRVGRPRAVPVSVRAGFLSRARRAGGIRRPSARRPDPARGRSRRGARRARHRRRRARARGAAGQPPRRSREARRCRSPAPPSCWPRGFPGLVMHRADGDARACATCSPRAAPRSRPTRGVRMLDGQARRALAAADVVLVASGTATLETALFKRPMVVAYKLGCDHRVPAAHVRAGEDQAFLAAQSARGQGAGAGVLPGSRERARISPTRWRTGSSIPTKWRACSASSRRSTRACVAMAPSAPRPKSRELLEARAATP